MASSAPGDFVFQDQARQHFGDQLAQRFATLKPEAPDAAVAAERARFMRAPLVIAVISCVQEHPKIPSGSNSCLRAACQNLLVAANLMGFAAQWLTEWYAYDSVIDQVLG
ncbi:MAG: hypothetical protein CM15mP120_18170 [Pseudomonadota bacterium]|nr:MAG: hypothetical protein CM15mP120_18170 [Pseudomonadota bacterium]